MTVIFNWRDDCQVINLTLPFPLLAKERVKVRLRILKKIHFHEFNMNTDMNDLVPSEFYLSQNYPNPFKEKTIIKFCVAYKTRVKIKVFDSDGELIKTLVDEEKEAGTFEIEFSAKGGDALNLASRVYFYQLEAGDFLSRKKMTLLR
jgi:hypothetical protein